MKKNMGTADRITRLILAIVIGILYYMGEITGTAAIVLGLFAAIFLITSALSFCPLYLPFKLSTAGSTESGQQDPA